MNDYKLKAKGRALTSIGKNKNIRLRDSGFIPANLIAKGQSTILSLPEKDFQLLIQRGLRSSSIIDLCLETESGTSEHKVVVKEIQRHPVNGRFLHADFYKTTNGEQLSVKIGVEVKGIAKGVKLGGLMEQHINFINVRTEPEKLQEKVEVDVSDLDIGAVIRFDDLKIPKEWTVIGIKANPIVLKIAHARVVSTVEESGAEESSDETPSDE